MDMNIYQIECQRTRVYRDQFKLIYPALKLNGEAGEVAEVIGKVMRGDYSPEPPEDMDEVVVIIQRNQELKAKIEAELGDVLWYIAAIASDLNMSLNDIGKFNLKKLQLRKAAGKVQGSGSDR